MEIAHEGKPRHVINYVFHHSKPGAHMGAPTEANGMACDWVENRDEVEEKRAETKGKRARKRGRIEGHGPTGIRVTNW
jgi:hypothetical protein